MYLWWQFKYGLRHLFRQQAWRRDVLDEIHQYIDDSAAAWQLLGFSPEDARRAAISEFGDPEKTVLEMESYGWENSLHQLVRDGSTAIRHLCRYRSFALLTLLMLACSMGVNLAAAGLADSLLYRRIASVDGGTLVRLTTVWPSTNHSTDRVTAPDMSDVRDAVSAFSSVSLYQAGNAAVQVEGKADYLPISKVDLKFADLFAIQAVRGRVFQQTEARKAAMVAEGFARAHFRSEADAIGRTILVDGDRLTIVGVLPRSFNFPEGTQVWEAASWLPQPSSRTAFNYQAVARVRGDSDVRAAEQQLVTLSSAMLVQHGGSGDHKSIRLEPLRASISRDGRVAVLLIWSFASVLFLLALLHVAGLHLSCARDWAVWTASVSMPAIAPSRIRRFLMIEGVSMSLLGGGGGIALSVALSEGGIRLSQKILSSKIGPAPLNLHTVMLALMLISAATCVTSWLPWRKVSKVLRENAAKRNDESPTLERSVVTNSLALTATFLLLCGAGLLGREVNALRHADLGFEKTNLIVMNTSSQSYTWNTPEATVSQMSALLTQLSAIPGTKSTAGIMGLPMSEYGSNGDYEVHSSEKAHGRSHPPADFSVITPNYFHTMRIPVIRGRDFTTDDLPQGRPVAIISATLARQSFGTLDVLGEQIRCGLDSGQWMTIVGVVGDVRQDSPADHVRGDLYMPLAQHSRYAGQMSLVMRTGDTVDQIRKPALIATARVDPTIAVNFVTMDQLVSAAIEGECLRAQGAGVLAALAVLFLVIGLFGRLSSQGNHAGVFRSLAISIGIGVAMLVLLSPYTKTAFKLVPPLDPLPILGAAVLLSFAVLSVGWIARVSPYPNFNQGPVWSP